MSKKIISQRYKENGNGQEEIHQNVEIPPRPSVMISSGEDSERSLSSSSAYPSSICDSDDSPSESDNENDCPNQNDQFCDCSFDSESDANINCNAGPSKRYSTRDVLTERTKICHECNKKFRDSSKPLAGHVNLRWRAYSYDSSSSESNSSNDSDIPDEEVEQILQQFRSCQTDFVCKSILIERNMPRPFDIEDGILRINRNSYSRYFGHHRNMSCNPRKYAKNPHYKNRYLASRRRKKIKAGVEKALVELAKEESDKIRIGKKVISRLYLRDVMKVVSDSVKNQK